MPSVEAKVEALAIAYVELLKFLEERHVIKNHFQLMTAVNKAAEHTNASQETKDALADLACMIRPTRRGMCEHQPDCYWNKCCTPPLSAIESMLEPDHPNDENAREG